MGAPQRRAVRQVDVTAGPEPQRRVAGGRRHGPIDGAGRGGIGSVVGRGLVGRRRRGVQDVEAGQQMPLQVGMRGVDARVDDGHDHALTGTDPVRVVGADQSERILVRVVAAAHAALVERVARLLRPHFRRPETHVGLDAIHSRRGAQVWRLRGGKRDEVRAQRGIAAIARRIIGMVDRIDVGARFERHNDRQTGRRSCPRRRCTRRGGYGRRAEG